MTTFLLDANVLITLTVREHEHHARAAAWAAGVEKVALCPVVEGALVRFLIRTFGRAPTARDVLRRMHADPRCSFWPDSVSYADVDLGHVVGHRQVTDAYLLGLVASREKARLATLDASLAGVDPQRVRLLP